MKKAIFHLVVWAAAFSVVSGLAVKSGWWPAAAQGAAGDLVIDWAGKLTGEPIFTVTDMVPGQVEAETVTVTNNDTAARKVGVRAAPTAAGGLADALSAVVKVDGLPVYGEGSGTGFKTLAEFFLASAAPGALELVELGAGDTAEIVFEAALVPEVGDFFQNRSVTFDITLGLAGAETQVPEECGGDSFNLTGEVIVGTAGSDRLRGTPGNDVIFGLEGSDSIRGYGGDDCLVGGEGSDSLRGYDGADVLLGGGGSDSLKGQNGPDKLFGGAGKDSLKGGRGNDELYGGAGDDSLKGGPGDDKLIGDAGEDVAKGQRGVDECDAEVEKTCES